MAYSKESNAKKSAMPQFNEGHWEKKPSETDCAGGRYSSEFGQAEEYKKSVDSLAGYVRNHRMKH